MGRKFDQRLGKKKGMEGEDEDEQGKIESRFVTGTVQCSMIGIKL